LEGLSQLDDETIKSSWIGFGVFISRQMRMGRGVSINKFGVFNFSAPEISMPGINNQETRDKKFRHPIFVVSTEFCLGSGLRPGIVTG